MLLLGQALSGGISPVLAVLADDEVGIVCLCLELFGLEVPLCLDACGELMRATGCSK